jgi:hypothetical protein
MPRFPAAPAAELAPAPAADIAPPAPKDAPAAPPLPARPPSRSDPGTALILHEVSVTEPSSLQVQLLSGSYAVPFALHARALPLSQRSDPGWHPESEPQPQTTYIAHATGAPTRKPLRSRS